MEGIAPGNVTDNDEMLDTLMMMGVSLPEARARVCAIRSSRPAATFTAVFGGGAIVECANKARRDLNTVGLRALDLRTRKPDGQPWNFSLRTDRRLTSELIDQDQPDWLIGSPTCTAFSIWNYAMNYPKMAQEKVAQAISEGRTHLNFVVSLYRKQMMRGR